MSKKSEISPSLVLILPKDLEVGNFQLPRLKNTSIEKLQWIELIQQYYPQVFEVITRHPDYMKLYRIAVYRPYMQLEFEWMESTIGNFFNKFEQPPPFRKYAGALVKMPVLKTTEEKIVESFKRYYESVLLTNGPAPSVQPEIASGSGIHSPPPLLPPPPPPPPRPRTPSEPPQPEPLPKIRLCHDSLSTTPSVSSVMEKDVEELRNNTLRKSNPPKRKHW